MPEASPTVAAEIYEKLSPQVTKADAALRELQSQDPSDIDGVRAILETVQQDIGGLLTMIETNSKEDIFFKELIAHDAGNYVFYLIDFVERLQTAVSYSISTVLEKDLPEIPVNDPRRKSNFMTNLAKLMEKYCEGKEEPNEELTVACKKLDYASKDLIRFRDDVREDDDTPFADLFLQQFGGNCTALDIPNLRTRIMAYCRSTETTSEETAQLRRDIQLPGKLGGKNYLTTWRTRVQEQLQDIDKHRSELWAKMWNVLRAVESAEYWVPGHTLKPQRLAMGTFLEEAMPSLLLRCGRGADKCLTVNNNVPEAEASFHQGTVGNLLMNIISNAKKRGQAEHISISTTEDGETVTITVEDDGTGFEASEEQLFTPGFTTSGDGKGLGLADANKRMEAFGGSIHAEGHGGLQNSNGTKGAKFTLILKKS